MLNPVQLRTLAAIIRTGSFADAARQLDYTSSAVSQQIASLEREIGAQLFERRPQSVHPTSAAQFLTERSRPVLAALGELEMEVEELSMGGLGQLRLGSFPTASKSLLPPALATLVNEFPGVDIELDEGEPMKLLPQLSDAVLDVALIYRYDLVPYRWPRSTPSQQLLTEELVLLLPVTHPLAGRSPLDWEKLAAETWITSQDDTDGYRCLIRLAAAAGVAPHVAYRSNDYDVIRGLVAAGLGIALVPALGVVPHPGIVSSRIESVYARRRISVVWRTRTHGASPPVAVAALESAARQVAAERTDLVWND